MTRSEKRTTRPRAPAASVDDYLAALPAAQRAALRRLRRIIKAAAPGAAEGISYQIPAFRYRRLLVGFAAVSSHCTFHLMSTRVMKAHAAELKGCEVGRGSIRFEAGRPLPARLVTRLVKARIAEIKDRDAR